MKLEELEKTMPPLYPIGARVRFHARGRYQPLEGVVVRTWLKWPRSPVRWYRILQDGLDNCNRVVEDDIWRLI